MKTFEQHIQEIIDERGSTLQALLAALPLPISKEVISDAAKRYATQVGRDALDRAAESAKLKTVATPMGDYLAIDKESITNTKIILP